jgi:hypothetical protein
VVPVLTPPELLVGAGQVLRGKCPEQGEFPGKHSGSNDLSKFFCIAARRFPATGNSKNL